MKYLRIPLSRWVVAGAVALGLLFGNDAVIAILSPIINSIGALMPAA